MAVEQTPGPVVKVARLTDPAGHQQPGITGFNNPLRNMLDRFIFVDLDDILIFSKGIRKHMHHAGREIPIPRPVGVLPGVHHWHREHSDGPGKVSVVKEWPRLESHKQLQRFLEFPSSTHVLSGTIALWRSHS